MDVGPREASLAAVAGHGGLVVLRSFGKFFGLAGVRLGFALTDRARAAQIDSQLGPWAVAGPTLEYGIRALGDIAWQEAMRRQLSEDTARLDALFVLHGVPVAGGTSLFRYVDFGSAPSLFSALGRQGILLRHFTERPHTLRSGLPGSEEEWQRLDTALAGWAAKENGSQNRIRA